MRHKPTVPVLKLAGILVNVGLGGKPCGLDGVLRLAGGHVNVGLGDLRLAGSHVNGAEGHIDGQLLAAAHVLCLEGCLLGDLESFLL